MSLTETELTRFFFAVALLLVGAHACGYVLRRLSLPRVIGEIGGGLLLGPTALGFLAPGVHEWIFHAFASEEKLVSLISWFGLVLLMFVSGFEVQKSFSKDDRNTIGAVILGSTLVPFAAGWLAPALYDFSPYMGPQRNLLALRLIIAIAVAVTSIPVISKIFLDLNIMETHFAKIVLAAATTHDIILYVALAVATGLVTSKAASGWAMVSAIGITSAFFGVALFVMPRLMRFTGRLRYNVLLEASPGGYILSFCFLFAAIASLLNVNVVFGAFLAGLVVNLVADERFEQPKRYLKEVALDFFIPLYFAIVGLKLDLIHHLDLPFLLGFLLFSSFFETSGTIAAARLIKKDWLSSFNLGVAMNTRGGPGIVLATVAFDYGIIDETFFAALVTIAILTSLLAGWWFRYVLSRGWPLLTDPH
jgi:Kef-type K+ transport system membrane component KefB